MAAVDIDMLFSIAAVDMKAQQLMCKCEHVCISAPRLSDKMSGNAPQGVRLSDGSRGSTNSACCAVCRNTLNLFSSAQHI